MFFGFSFFNKKPAEKLPIDHPHLNAEETVRQHDIEHDSALAKKLAEPYNERPRSKKG